ncbi:MAG: nucleotidyl transferase AbiEii/AbiGii toxin family protein [Bacteroidota bacterium]
MSHQINITRIKGVHHALGELNETIVFVGGATISLYADKPEQTDVRPTNDVDVLLEIGSYSEYVRIQEKLSALGFSVDQESKVTCRYKYQGLTVDIMPTNAAALGFTNSWYTKGFSELVEYQIDDRTIVNIFSPPYFIASKMEAFKGRGKNDGRTSRDLEDIVFVLDNRKAIWKELHECGGDVHAYIITEMKALLSNANIREWLSGHLEYETADERSSMILSKIAKLVEGEV